MARGNGLARGGQAEHAVGRRAGHPERGRERKELPARHAAGTGVGRELRHRGVNGFPIDGLLGHVDIPSCLIPPL